MLLFIGIANTTRKPAELPELPPIRQSNWVTQTTQDIALKYCDFSHKKDRVLCNQLITTGISGNPCPEKTTKNGETYIERLSANIAKKAYSVLNEANGVFCGFTLDFEQNQISLYTDYLGLNQIFLYESEAGIIFANALWLIEKCIPKNTPFDEQALIEIGTLGHPLEDRTRRKGVRVLQPGSTLHIDSRAKTELVKYFDITKTRPINLSNEECIEALNALWRKAVFDRIDAGKAFSFLSGGMDSRLLVYTLKSFGINLETANFAPPNSMDRVFAEMAANAMKIPIWLHPTGDPNIDCLSETISTWALEDKYWGSNGQERIIWSGDGGSVGVGNVYLDDLTADLAENRKFEECAQHFCSTNKRIPIHRAYKHKNAEKLLINTITNILNECSSTNPARAPYFFLMLNDQRRHLDKHRESIHIRGFDFALPFFDKRLIEFISSQPLKTFNMHRAYDLLYQRIGGTLNSTPWQTYPSHIPCPLPLPKGLNYQWGREFHSTPSQKKQIRERAWKTLKFATHPTTKQPIINRGYIALGSILTLCGISDHSYLYQCIAPLEAPPENLNQPN